MGPPGLDQVWGSPGASEQRAAASGESEVRGEAWAGECRDPLSALVRVTWRGRAGQMRGREACRGQTSWEGVF